MRALILMIFATLVFACHSSPRSGNEVSASVSEPSATEPHACDDREVTERLGRLHRLAVATDALPDRQVDDLREILAGLQPTFSDAGSGYPGAPRFASSSVDADPASAIYHDPRFQGEEQPHILHWRNETLGRSSDWPAAIRRLGKPDAVYLALWRETSHEEVETLLATLREAGVRDVRALGTQNLPDLDELAAPEEAARLFGEMNADEGNRVAARAFATFELERIVFSAAGHDAEVDSRLLEPTMSFTERSAAYVDFLQREYHRSGCELDPDYLAWLYRVRFLREPPIALRALPTERVPPGSTWQEIVNAAN